MRKVAIVAAGMTRFGELWEWSLRDLFREAASEALKRAGAERLDSIYVGNMSAGQFVGQEHIGPLFADQLGMSGVAATIPGSGAGGRVTKKDILRYIELRDVTVARDQKPGDLLPLTPMRRSIAEHPDRISPDYVRGRADGSESERDKTVRVAARRVGRV